MRNTRLACLVAALLLTSCAVLDKVVPLYDMDSGEQVGTTTVGDMAADALDGSSQPVADAVSGALSAVTGNPALGGAAGLGILSLLGAGAGAMRRNRKS